MKLLFRLPASFRLPLLAMAFLATASPVGAQPYPSNLIRIVVSAAAGTPPDIISRIVARELSESEGWRVVVENKPGAMHTIAGAEVLKQPADGYAILSTSLPAMTARALLPHVNFRLETDFAPVIKLSTSYNVLVVHPSVPAKSVAELVALIKSQPDKLTYSSGGFGTPAHLAGELFKLQTGVRATHVPYQALSQAIGDLIGGTNQYQFVTTLPVIDLIATGKLRARGDGADARSCAEGRSDGGRGGISGPDRAGLGRLSGEERDPDRRRYPVERSHQQGAGKAERAGSPGESRCGACRRQRGRVRPVRQRPARLLGKGGKGLRDEDAPMSPATDFRVTLLGTGVPTPRPERFGPSTLIEAGDQKLLIDAGRGATIRLYQIGVPLGRIDALLLTHYHSDHTVGIPDLWLTGWLSSHYATRTTPFRVIGPTGANALMSNLEKAYAADVKIRIADEKLPPRGAAVTVEEFDADGVVYEKNGVKVIAFEVDHGDAIKPAYGYRIDYAGRTVVISGDTRYDQNVIKYGAGADLLIHEVAIARPELMPEPYIQRIMAHHTTAHEAGMVFAHTKPKQAAYTHLVFLASPQVPAATIADLVADTRQTYGGPLEVGEDLMSFEIGETITVRRREA